MGPLDTIDMSRNVNDVHPCPMYIGPNVHITIRYQFFSLGHVHWAQWTSNGFILMGPMDPITKQCWVIQGITLMLFIGPNRHNGPNRRNGPNGHKGHNGQPKNQILFQRWIALHFGVRNFRIRKYIGRTLDVHWMSDEPIDSKIFERQDVKRFGCVIQFDFVVVHWVYCQLCPLRPLDPLGPLVPWSPLGPFGSLGPLDNITYIPWITQHRLVIGPTQMNPMDVHWVQWTKIESMFPFGPIDNGHVHCFQ